MGHLGFLQLSKTCTLRFTKVRTLSLTLVTGSHIQVLMSGEGGGTDLPDPEPIRTVMDTTESSDEDSEDIDILIFTPEENKKTVLHFLSAFMYACL
jgi:hypothetical protein